MKSLANKCKPKRLRLSPEQKAALLRQKKRKQALRTLELLKSSSGLVAQEVKGIFRQSRKPAKRGKGDKGVGGIPSGSEAESSSIPPKAMRRCGRQ